MSHGSAPAAAGPSVSLPTLTPGPYRKRLGFVVAIATIGGLLFGYDTSVINGAGGLMARPDQLDLSPFQLGIAVSSLVFASAVGALTGGRISDRIGRRRTIAIMAVMFVVGVVIVVAAPGLGMVVAGRIILGLAVGAASVVVPVYLAELAPFEIRGSLAGRNEFMIVFGQLLAIVMNAIIGSIWGEAFPWVWRIMFALAAIPALALLIGLSRLPESPRWLLDKGYDNEALRVLQGLRPEGRAELELKDIINTRDAEAQQTSWSLGKIFSNKNLIRILLIGCALAFFQQTTGINAMMYYGVEVLRTAGFGNSGAMIANIVPALIAVIAGLIALQMMDRFSRRKTFLWGYGLVAVSHLLISAAGEYFPDNAAKPYVLLLLIVFFVGSMQLCLNIATWVTLSEIFPQKMRAFGMGVTVFILWMANAGLSLVFPVVIDALGLAGTFLAFAVLNIIAYFFVLSFVPETRGRTLEELEEDVTSGAIFQKDTMKAKY